MLTLTGLLQLQQLSRCEVTHAALPGCALPKMRDAVETGHAASQQHTRRLEQPCALGRHWIAQAVGRCSTWKCCVFHLRPLMWDTVCRSASSSSPSACEPGDDES